MIPIPVVEVRYLPEGWKESADEIDRDFIHGFRRLVPGVYDWSCPENENSATFLVVIRDPKIRFFILRPKYAEKVNALINASDAS
jgi:hypothetical protein